MSAPADAVVRRPVVNRGDAIAVWFSCGAASAVAAKKTFDIYGDIATIRVINNPVAEEHPDNRRFLVDVERWLGVEIETATNTKYPNASAVEVWQQRRFMAGPQGAPCTTELKRVARQQWELQNKVDWIVLGFTFDEQDRAAKFARRERKNLLPILVDECITKADCFRILFAADIKPPEIYAMGYPNANCIGCVKATSPTYWNHVRRVHPEVFAERAKLSRELGAKLVRVNNQRMFLDELPSDAEGEPMRAMDFECGSFCEGLLF